MSTKLATVLIADFTTNLSTALIVGGTTATLQSNLDDDNLTIPDGTIFLTLDGANSSKEHIFATKTGANLTSIMSVSRQGVQTSGVVRAHRIGSTVSLTDFAHILYMKNLLNGTTTLDATTPLGYDGTASITTANQLATKAYVDGVAIAGAPKATDTVYGITKLSVAAVSGTVPIAVGDNDGRVPTQAENDALVGTSGTPSTSNKFVTDADTTATPTASKVVRYTAAGYVPGVLSGGTGADGALTISSGTTNIDVGAVAVYIKNYSSISITGTGKLTFSNPHSGGTLVVLKNTGDTTITSSATPAIDLSGMGAATDTLANGILDDAGGHQGQVGSSGGGSTAGGTQLTNRGLYISSSFVGANGTFHLAPGSGGGSGAGSSVFAPTGGSGAGSVAAAGGAGNNSAAGSNAAGASAGGGGGTVGSWNGGGTPGLGGRGGGALLIQGAGSLNFTGLIYLKGLIGSVGTGTTGSGGGGAGGMGLILYGGTLTASSGTFDSSGGAGASSAYAGGSAGASNTNSGKVLAFSAAI